MNNSNLKSNKGFTLIELIVAMAIFVVVISLTMGIFVKAIEGQRKVKAIQNVQENARFVLERMAREIRMSTINTSAGNNLGITAYKVTGDESVIYSLSGDQILRNGEAVTSSQIQVSQLKFYVNQDPNIQDRVTIMIAVQNIAQKPKQQVKINLQTTISLRDY